MSPTLPELRKSFRAAGDRMAAEEVARGRWSQTWARNNDAGRLCADTMATDAFRDPNKGAAMLAGECALIIGEMVECSFELRRAA